MPGQLPVVPQFQNATVHGGPAEFEAVVAHIQPLLVSPWERDEEREKEPILRRTGDYRVYHRHAGELGPGLRLFLLGDGTGRIHVPNIVPDVSGELTIDQYNSALTDFVDRFLRPAAERAGLTVQVRPPVFDPVVELGDDVASALAAFSRGANRSTGNAHPMDRDRWNRFVVLAHRSGKGWSATQLGKWLVLDGWTEELASDLANDYDAGLSLLDYAANH